MGGRTLQASDLTAVPGMGSPKRFDTAYGSLRRCLERPDGNEARRRLRENDAATELVGLTMR